MVLHFFIACGAHVGVALHVFLHINIACGASVGVVLLVVVSLLFAIHVSHKWKYMYGSGGGGLGNLHFELTL